MRFQFWVAVLSVLAVACSGGGSDSSSDGLGEEGEALTRASFPSVASVKLTQHGRPPNPPSEIGVVEDDAPVRKVIGAIKKLSPSAHVPRCAEPQHYYSFTLRDAREKEVARVVMDCGAYGVLEQGDSTAHVRVYDAAFKAFAVPAP